MTANETFRMWVGLRLRSLSGAVVRLTIGVAEHPL